MRKTPLLKGGVAQSPAVSQVTVRGSLGIPAMLPHQCITPPPHPCVSLGPALLGATVGKEEGHPRKRSAPGIDPNAWVPWDHWASFSLKGRLQATVLPPPPPSHGAEAEGSLCEEQHQILPAPGLRPRYARHPSTTIVLGTCTHEPDTSQLQGPDSPAIHSTDTWEHSSVPGSVRGPEREQE